MNTVEPVTHFLALGVIILVSGFFALMVFGMACYKSGIETDESEFETEPGEIDATYYPDDEDHVIF